MGEKAIELLENWFCISLHSSIVLPRRDKMLVENGILFSKSRQGRNMILLDKNISSLKGFVLMSICFLPTFGPYGTSVDSLRKVIGLTHLQFIGVVLSREHDVDRNIRTFFIEVPSGTTYNSSGKPKTYF